MESIQVESLLCIASHAATQLISYEGENYTLKNQRRGTRVQWHFCKCTDDSYFEHEIRMHNRQTYTQILNDYYLQMNGLTTATNPYIFPQPLNELQCFKAIFYQDI